MSHEASNLILSLSRIYSPKQNKEEWEFPAVKAVFYWICQQVITYHSDGESIKTWEEQIPA